MVLAWIGIYLTAWAFAWASVHRLTGRVGFWLSYLGAVVIGPGLFGGLAFLLYRGTERGAALDLAQFVGFVGAAVAALAFPIQRWRIWRAARG